MEEDLTKYGFMRVKSSFWKGYSLQGNFLMTILDLQETFFAYKLAYLMTKMRQILNLAARYKIYSSLLVHVDAKMMCICMLMQLLEGQL